MANKIYPLWAAELMKGTAGYDLDGTGATGVWCALIDTGTVTYNAAHDFYDDIAAGVVGTPVEITTNTMAAGVFDGDDCVYTALTGNSVEALILYRKNAGANSTWPLVAYIDTGITGVPFTPSGGNVTIAWNASGIFTFSG